MLINHYGFTSGISFGINIFIGVFFYIDISKKIEIMLFKTKKSYSCKFYRIKNFFFEDFVKIKKIWTFSVI